MVTPIKQTTNRVVVSTFIGLRDKSRPVSDSRIYWREYHDDHIKEALRKAFHAGKRWGQRSKLAEVNND